MNPGKGKIQYEVFMGGLIQGSIESRSDYYNDGDWQIMLTYFLSILGQCRVTNALVLALKIPFFSESTL